MEKLRLLAFAAIVMTTIGLLARTTQAREEGAKRLAATPHGRYSYNQILQRSAPIAEALRHQPGTVTFNFSGIPMVMGTREGTLRPMWLTDAISPADNYQVHMVWDGLSGELVSVSQTKQKYDKQLPTGFRFADVVRVSGSWLTTLGISLEDTGWQPERDVFHDGFIWRITWHTVDHRVQMVFDSRTGDLIMAESIRPISVPMRTASCNSAVKRFRGI